MVVNSVQQAPHVVHLVLSLAHGGLERLVVDWTNARNRRYPGSTRIICLDEPGDLASQVEGDTVICLHADRSRSPWDRQAVAKLRTWARGQKSEVRGQGSEGEEQAEGGDQKPESETSTCHLPPATCHPSPILHAHNLAAWQYAVLAAWGTGVRTVYTQHGANTHNQSVRDRLRARLLAFLTDECVAVSTATARSMSRSLWIPRSRIRVVANGVGGADGGGRWEVGGAQCGADVPVRLACEGVAPRLLSRNNIRRNLGIPEDAIVIGSVGRLAHVKGYDRLIKAFASTFHLPPPTSLLLVGAGPERESLERLATDLGMAARVRFAGFQADPQPFLHAMDLFVLSSRSEGLSMGLLEAMAVGVTVAVTDVGANSEVIDGGTCGCLLPDDEAQWPGVLAAVVNDPARLNAMTDRARCRVKEHYSLQATLDGYETLYRRLVGAGR